MLLGYLECKEIMCLKRQTSLKVVPMLPPMIPPPPPLILSLCFYSPRFLPFIHGPDSALRLIFTSFEISSCESNDLVDLLGRVYEVPCAQVRRDVRVNAFDFGVR